MSEAPIHWLKEKTCYGTQNPCKHCGMDMDMEPFCMSKDVRDMRTAITGRDYDWGLDVNPAMQLCKLVFWEPRNV